MLVLAHRGAGWQKSDIVENTLEAFELAHSKGVDGIETDVRMTKEDELVLCHDPVKQSSNLTSVKELLDWAPDDFLINLEIKEPKAGPAIIPLLKEYSHKRFLITSFWHNIAFKVSKASNTDCGLLMPVRPVFVQTLLQLVPMKLEYIIWDYQVFDPTVTLQLDKYKHMVYNCQSEVVGNIDGIISDDLDVHTLQV